MPSLVVRDAGQPAYLRILEARSGRNDLLAEEPQLQAAVVVAVTMAVAGAAAAPAVAPAMVSATSSSRASFVSPNAILRTSRRSRSDPACGLDTQPR